MKLLFDHNLSHKLVFLLKDIFPNSTQTRLINLDRAGDHVIWEHAKDGLYTVVTLDSDFYDLSSLYGHPPKVIWLRCGNQSVPYIAHLLQFNLQRIQGLEDDAFLGCLEIY